MVFWWQWKGSWDVLSPVWLSCASMGVSIILPFWALTSLRNEGYLCSGISLLTAVQHICADSWIWKEGGKKLNRTGYPKPSPLGSHRFGRHLIFSQKVSLVSGLSVCASTLVWASGYSSSLIRLQHGEPRTWWALSAERAVLLSSLDGGQEGRVLIGVRPWLIFLSILRGFKATFPASEQRVFGCVEVPPCGSWACWSKKYPIHRAGRITFEKELLTYSGGHSFNPEVLAVWNLCLGLFLFLSSASLMYKEPSTPLSQLSAQAVRLQTFSWSPPRAPWILLSLLLWLLETPKSLCRSRSRVFTCVNKTATTSLSF